MPSANPLARVPRGRRWRSATAGPSADGTIFEVFDPRFWAFQLGLAGTGGSADRRSIGIEMASEGWLEERGEEVGTPGRHFDFDRALFGYRGVLVHHQVRADKADLLPGFPWDRLMEGAGLAVE